MDTYVLIARHLGKVSGEKIYSYNKLRYMISLGWRVLFFTGEKEKTVMDGVENYQHYVFPALTYTPWCYSFREVEKTINDIASILNSDKSGKCIIETDSVNRAIWGELIAKRTNAKHMAFLLQERHQYDPSIRAFLSFKYERHEVAGVTKQSINQMLQDDTIQRRDDTKIAAFCNNTVEECEDSISNELSHDVKYTFGSLGRLDKQCVPAILEGFIEFATAHKPDKFNLVLIGGATGKKKIQDIKKKIAECENINLLITDYLYPIPASLIRHIDLFVSTAGSALVTYIFHRPTIRVHPNTGEPSAIMGMKGMETESMFDILPNTSLVECIGKALENEKEISYRINYYENYNKRMNEEFNRQLSMADITNKQGYYDEGLLMQIKPTHIKSPSFHRTVGHLFGAKGLNNTIRILKSIKKV